MEKKYKEIVATPDKNNGLHPNHKISVSEDGKIVAKYPGQPTGRIVVISQAHAELQNSRPTLTGCIYEEVKGKVKPVDESADIRKALFAEAKELGLKVAGNIKTEALQEKINEAKTEE